MMFAPASFSSVDTAATIPGRSSPDTMSRMLDSGSRSAARRRRAAPLSVVVLTFSPRPPRGSDVRAAPAAVVLGACGDRVGHGAHDDADLGLLVRLDRGLLRVGLLAPEQGELGADLDIGVDRREREAAALVRAVTGEHGQADDLAVGVHD